MVQDAIIYARFSKADQIRGHSIERQLENAREICTARGLATSPSLTFIEQGRSAFSGANRAKGSLLANLELEIKSGAHSGRTLVVEHLDRISRQGWQEVLDFLRACSDAGVNVATWDGLRFYPARQPVQMVEVIEIILKSQLAHEESDKKSKRIRKSFAAKRDEAVSGSGKRIASRPPSWIRRVPGGYELIEQHAKVVREAHRLCQSGYGTAQIARIFNDRSIPTWRADSNGWHESYIGRMLTMRTAIGEYVSSQYGTRILDYYPPVITVEEYNRTQAARAKRAIPAARGRRGTAQTNLFQGIVRCSHCGGPMQMKPSRYIGKTEGRKYASGHTSRTCVLSAASYLRCVNALRRVTDAGGNRLCANGKTVRYERLEPAVLDKIMTVALDNDRFNVAEISHTRIALAEAERQLDHHMQALENIKENLKLKVSVTLMEMLTDMEEKIDAAKSERESLAKRLTREKGTQPSAAFLARIKATRAAMSNPDHDTRRDARTMVHDSLKEVLSDMLCDEQGNVVVVVANGLAAFRVNFAGVIDWEHDSSADPRAIVALTTEAFAANKGLVTEVIDRSMRAQSA